MDQTASAHQIVLRIGECGENSGMDRHIRLCARGNHQKRLKLDASLHVTLQILTVAAHEFCNWLGSILIYRYIVTAMRLKIMLFLMPS
jgi:hypothetical protein